VTTIRVPADRDAPRAIRGWLVDALTVTPFRAAEASLVVSELVGRSVVGTPDDEIEVVAEEAAARWRVTVNPVAEPDDLTIGVLERFSARWGRDGAAVWFDVRAPGSATASVRAMDLDDLLETADSDPDARDEVVRRLTPVVTGISRRYRNKGIADGDLEQAAVLALLKALDRYDPDAGDFERYASATTSGEMKRLLRDRAWSVRVPRSLQERALEVGRRREQMAQALGRSPSARELADDLDIGLDEVVEALGATSAYTSASIDTPAPGTERALEQVLPDPSSDLELVERLGDLAPAIAKLPDRQQAIVRYRFVDELTQSEIAERIGVSQMHVSRLLRRALASLRDEVDV
jgi:RNA polymerase sigma-B factor